MKKSLFAALLLTGCSWSTFDDLGDQTWVDSVGAASGVQPNEFIGLAAPGVTNQNSVFVALGRATDSVGSYSYDADGARASVGKDIRGGSTQFGPFGPDVVIAGDPYSSNIGVAATTGATDTGDTKLANFNADAIDTIVTQNDFNQNATTPLDGPIQPTGLVYARTDDDSVGSTTTDAVLARGNQIAMVSDYAATGATLSTCLGATANDTVLSVASGEFDGVVGDDELVAVVNDASGTAPQAIIFHGDAITTTWENDTATLNTCFDDGDINFPQRHAIARIAGPSGDKDWGKSIVVADFDGDGAPDIAIGSPATSKVMVYLNSAGAFGMVNVPPPTDAGAFGTSLAAGDLDGDGNAELVVGAPDSSVDGTTHAGSVYVYSFDGTGFDTQPLVLHDSQPETEQRVGQSVAIVPWGSTQHVLILGGDHEIFTYFRTALYDDVRGR